MANQLAKGTLAALLAVLMSGGSSLAQTANNTPDKNGSWPQYLGVLLGGEVATINSARRAAKDGRNVEAAKLFEQAIDAVPSRRLELLREYADALTFSDRGAMAVPLYKELIASSTLSSEEKTFAQTRLALALTWSGQYQEALSAYDDLLTRAPADADLIVHRARVLAWLGRQSDAIVALDRLGPEKWAAGPLGTLGDEILIDAARSAARADQNESSARLFDRAIRHNARLRVDLLQEYADQLTFAHRASEAVPLYREGLSKFSPDSDSYEKAQRGLALALTWGGAPSEALNAWAAYLKNTPRDVDAMIHQAQIYSSLHQNEKALQAYRSVYTSNHQNAAAKRGVVEESITLARSAARNNRNADAATYFLAAMEFDGRKRKELLREYADQLTFSGRSADAVPLYNEVLEDSALSMPDRKLAMAGLARAYEWAGQAEPASQTYAELAGAFPDDNSLQWTSMVISARRAAKEDRNTEAAQLFAEAIDLEPARRTEILQEYADQLSYTGHSEAAIALYEEVLNRPNLPNAERVVAKKGLAQAYGWSDHFDAAKATYNELIAEFPEEVALQWDMLVLSARQAAKEDRNKEAADLFAQAMDIGPDWRMDILQEYADQLSYTGRSENAIAFYREVLSQPNLPKSERVAAKKGLAHAYGWTGRYDQANLAYNELVTEFPQDMSLQWDRFVLFARQAAKEDRNKEAADLFAKAMDVGPGWRMDILQEYADQLSYSARSESAIPLYLEVLHQTNLPEAERLAAKKGLAQAYGWSGHFDNAQTAYKELIAEFPKDRSLQWDLLVLSARQAAKEDRNQESADLFAKAIDLGPERRADVLLEYADQLSFTGRSYNGVSLYLEVLGLPQLKNEDRWSAKKGLAHAYGWAERFEEAKPVYEELIKQFPKDVVLRWDLVVLSARQAAKEDRNKDAANLFAEAIDLLPARRTVILKEYADKLTYSNSAKEAVPLYRELLAKGGKPADMRSVQLNLALALSWDNQLQASLSEYEHLTAADPKDIDAANGRARVLSWSGHQSDAEDAFRQVLALSADNAEAQRGLAQVEDWQGHHRAAQAILTQRLHDDPNDLEARRQLAQSLVWIGRPDKAMEELAVAFGNRPGPGAVANLREQVATLRARAAAPRTATTGLNLAQEMSDETSPLGDLDRWLNYDLASTGDTSQIASSGTGQPQNYDLAAGAETNELAGTGEISQLESEPLPLIQAFAAR